MALKKIVIEKVLPSEPGMYWLKKGKKSSWEIVEVSAWGGNDSWNGDGVLVFLNGQHYQNVSIDNPDDWEWAECNKPE